VSPRARSTVLYVLGHFSQMVQSILDKRMLRWFHDADSKRRIGNLAVLLLLSE